MAQNGPQYVKVGGNLTIVGYKVIGGNPKPTSTWTFNGSVVSGSRFNELVLGQLTISSALLSDSGNYTNTLMNTVVGNSMSIKNTIELFVVGKLNQNPLSTTKAHKLLVELIIQILISVNFLNI